MMRFTYDISYYKEAFIKLQEVFLILKAQNTVIVLLVGYFYSLNRLKLRYRYIT